MRNTLKGIRRTLGTAVAQKAPTLTADIRAMLDATDAGMIGQRDRALVLLGFAGAFRRSELVKLDVEDCAFGKDGLTVTLRRSKTDQQGTGRKTGIPLRVESRDMPGSHSPKLDRAGWHWERPAVPVDQSPRTGEAGPFVRYRRGANRQETGRTCGPGCG